MKERIEATVDLTDCKYLHELHQRLKTSLDFPDYYGSNWDAFGDSLRFECPAEHIRIIGEHTMPDDLQKYLHYYS